MRREWKRGGFDTGTDGVRGVWVHDAGRECVVGIYIATDWRQAGVRFALPPGSLLLSVGLPFERFTAEWRLARVGPMWRVAFALFSLCITPRVPAVAGVEDGDEQPG